MQNHAQSTTRSPRPTRSRTASILRPLRLVTPLLALALAMTMSAVPQAQAAPAAAPAAATASSLQAAAINLAGAQRRISPVRAYRNRIIRNARRQAGTPYRYGATGPGSFDCSGYTSYVFRKAGRSIPRTSGAQAGASRRIAKSNRRRGDLVFFHSGGRVYHVGIYAGRGNIWHSPKPGTSVHRAKIWTSNHFYGRFRR